MSQQTLGEYLRETRKAHGHSLRAAGRYLETGYAHLSQVENSLHVHITADFIIKLHDGYGMDYTRMLEACRVSLALGKQLPLNQRK